jgi:hypothetical protein
LVLGKEHFYLLFSSVATSFLSLTAKSGFILRTTGISCVVFLIIPILILFHTSPAFSQEDIQVSPEAEAALEEELRYLRAETYVITPSRIPEKIKKTAASITVITDREIQQMGARHLIDVLQTVPGMRFHYSMIGTYRNSLVPYLFREERK